MSRRLSDLFLPRSRNASRSSETSTSSAVISGEPSRMDRRKLLGRGLQARGSD